MNIINLKEKISIVIAAAGKGTRSKLNYPKSLYKINNQSILHRIINTLSFLIFIPGYIDRDIEYISGLLDKNFKTNLNFKNIISKNYKKI